MAYELKHNGNNEILLSNEVSVDDFHRKELWEDTSQLELPFAKAKMSQWCFDGIRMIHSNWQYADRHEMAMKMDLDIVHMQFNLKGRFSMQSSDGRKDIRFDENQHNMLYTNKTSGILKNDMLLSSQFLVQFSKDTFLQLAEDSNEVLQRFAENVAAGRPISLADHNLPIDLHLQQAIQAVINCNYQGGIKKMFLFSKAMEILVLQAELFNNATTGKNRIVRTAYDRERIFFAKEYLLQHIENPPSLPALARIAGLNEFKLKHGFKELFNITAFGFVAEKRLELAKLYLQDHQKSIGDIAGMLGYSSIQHFSVAFKKKFGISPNKVR